MLLISVGANGVAGSQYSGEQGSSSILMTNRRARGSRKCDHLTRPHLEIDRAERIDVGLPLTHADCGMKTSETASATTIW